MLVDADRPVPAARIRRPDAPEITDPIGHRRINLLEHANEKHPLRLPLLLEFIDHKLLVELHCPPLNRS